MNARRIRTLLPGLVLTALIAAPGTAYAGNVSFWVGSPWFGAWSGHAGSGFWVGLDGLLIGAGHGGLWVSGGYPSGRWRHFDHRDHRDRRHHSRWGHGPVHASAYATYPDGRPYAPVVVVAPVNSTEASKSTPPSSEQNASPHGVFYDGYPVHGAGRLSLSGLPDNSRVLVDGVPIRDRDVPLLAGMHRVEVHAPRFRSINKDVEIRMNEIHDLAATMTRE